MAVLSKMIEQDLFGAGNEKLLRNNHPKIWFHHKCEFLLAVHMIVKHGSKPYDELPRILKRPILYATESLEEHWDVSTCTYHWGTNLASPEDQREKTFFLTYDSVERTSIVVSIYSMSHVYRLVFFANVIFVASSDLIKRGYQPEMNLWPPTRMNAH